MLICVEMAEAGRAFGSRPERAERYVRARAVTRWQAAVKRALDLIGSAAGLIVLSPVFLVIAALVKLDSKGPILHRSRRIGKDGESFRMYKFRTMYVDRQDDGGLTTAKDDSRVTSLGVVLRKYKLDELPQLFNVLGGEMSLVGPRPEFEEYTSRYEGEEKKILSVRPGITDYATLKFNNLSQVVGSEDADTVFEDSVLPVKNRLRVKYVEERSLGEDLRILRRTIWCLVLLALSRSGSRD